MKDKIKIRLNRLVQINLVKRYFRLSNMNNKASIKKNKKKKYKKKIKYLHHQKENLKI